MRKLLTIFAGTLITGSLLAGGLVTNTNQSAAWVRLPARNASVGVDAAYYNPAGLMKLENGFHVSLSNQSIWQKREVDNSYVGLNDHVYKGTVTAPVFPSIYAVYKMDKFAFSLGFNPIGGGGGALFKKGLPSFEMGPSDLVPALAAQGASAYSLDAYFKGTSTFLGYQAGVSYKVNDWLSIAVGLRYVTAKNTYEGHLKDIELNMGGTWSKASDIFTGLAAQLTSITTIPASLAPAIAEGAGGFTLAQLVGAGMMQATDKAKIEAGLAAIGVPAEQIPVMNVSQISGAVTLATPTLNAKAATATATATLVSDQSADASQSGSGISPIFSVNLSPSENLNIAFKYEMATKLNLKNKTVQDLLIGYTATGTPITMFPNGEMTRNDLPAMMTLGVDYKLSSSLKLSLGMDYYFDKTANYGHSIDADLNSETPTTPIANKDIIANNGLSFEAGLEYNISKKFLISGGYVWANKGVNSKYQSDLNYGLGTQTFGAGGAYSITDKIQINLGASYTAYMKDSKTGDHISSATGGDITYLETYKKSTFIIGVGVDLRF